MKTTNILIKFFIDLLDTNRACFIKSVLNPPEPERKITKVDLLTDELDVLIQEVENLHTCESRLFLKEFSKKYFFDLYWNDDVPSFYGFGEAGSLRYAIAIYKTYLKQQKNGLVK